MTIYLGLITSLSVIFIDRLSKFYVCAILFEYMNNPIQINSFFRIVSVWNKGVSFGIFSWLPSYLIIFVILFVLGSLMYLFHRTKDRFMRFSYSLMIGGAVGNLSDRLLFGSVFDFISLRFYNIYYPAFNFADMAITTGFFLIIIGYKSCNKK